MIKTSRYVKVDITNIFNISCEITTFSDQLRIGIVLFLKKFAKHENTYCYENLI